MQEGVHCTCLSFTLFWLSLIKKKKRKEMGKEMKKEKIAKKEEARKGGKSGK